MDIISILKHMYKYRLRGIYNDLSKYLINMLKFYGQWIALILGVLVTLVLFLETIITTIDINVYFNYIFSIAIVVGILGYMYSPLTLIIFSNPDIFYLIRSQKLFNKIAWIELIKKNIGMIATVLGIAFFIKSNIFLTFQKKNIAKHPPRTLCNRNCYRIFRKTSTTMSTSKKKARNTSRMELVKMMTLLVTV